MYKVKYSIDDGDFVVGREIKSRINAGFFFGREISPKDREDTLKRYHQPYLIGCPKVNLLRLYLTEMEKLKSAGKDCSDYGSSDYYRDDTRVVEVKPFAFRLGFNISAKSTERKSLNEILNLDEINELILTGDLPNNKNWNFVIEEHKQDLEIQK